MVVWSALCIMRSYKGVGMLRRSRFRSPWIVSSVEVYFVNIPSMVSCRQS